jgi:hypothetical protein
VPVSSPPTAPAPRARRTDGGLTLAGLVVVTVVPTTIVFLLSALILDGIGLWPNLIFLLACLYGALRIRRTELIAAVIAPPLVYVAGLMAASLGFGGGVLRGLAATFGEYIPLAAPWLFLTTFACLAIVIVRGRTGR